MNRSKVVIGIFVALILIVITIVLLACTVFVVRDVSVESDVSSYLVDEDRIVESSGLVMGRSIISINKEKVKAAIERENPYVEVKGIRRVFPSKVIISATIRTGIMLVKSEDGSYYALIDSSMKILNVAPAEDTVLTSATVVSGLKARLPPSEQRSPSPTQLAATYCVRSRHPLTIPNFRAGGSLLSLGKSPLILRMRLWLASKPIRAFRSCWTSPSPPPFTISYISACSTIPPRTWSSIIRMAISVLTEMSMPIAGKRPSIDGSFRIFFLKHRIFAIDNL